MNSLLNHYYNLKAHLHLMRLPEPSLGNGPTVVMTTYGKRRLTAHYAAKCILSGTVRPKHFIIYTPDGPTPNLTALEKHGVIVVTCDPHGVHDKWYHYTKRNSDPFVTVDDDFVYPHDTLATLTAAVACDPTCVTALRAREVTAHTYDRWPLVQHTVPSHSVLALGCGGVYYPQAMVEAMRASSRDFLTLCPKADDLWLKKVAFEAGILVRLGVVGRPLPMLSPGTPGTGLWHENVTKHGNDVQWQNILTTKMCAAMYQ